LTAAEYSGPAARLASATRIWLVAYGRRSDPATARPDLRQLLGNGFRRIGLWEVKNGSIALYVKRTPVGLPAESVPDPVLLDPGLPDGDGLDLCAEIREIVDRAHDHPSGNEPGCERSASRTPLWQRRRTSRWPGGPVRRRRG
jgi:CheY-like chemotaxis protein